MWKTLINSFKYMYTKLIDNNILNSIYEYDFVIYYINIG